MWSTILNTGVNYGTIKFIMGTARKITVEVPQELLEKAQEAIGAGITQAVRTGLTLVAASRTYDRLRRMRGKVRFSRTAAELKADR
jgi:Arc/MetJ-type ribon-helix-helix transcriptional regulator